MGPIWCQYSAYAVPVWYQWGTVLAQHKYGTSNVWTDMREVFNIEVGKFWKFSIYRMKMWK
jgi:hypothetical protein